MSTILSSEPLGKARQKNRCVVRLRRSWWHDAKGCHLRIDLLYLKRHCRGYNILEEDSSNIDFENVEANVQNLEECADGIYQVVTCNETRDWESGSIEEYDYRLAPYTPPAKGATT